MDRISSFAERLKELLEKKNITQAELARCTGISRSSISHYLKADWEAKQDAVYAIARATGVEFAWLMGYNVPMSADCITEHDTDEALYSMHYANLDISGTTVDRIHHLMDFFEFDAIAVGEMIGIPEIVMEQWLNYKCPAPVYVDKLLAFFHMQPADLLDPSDMQTYYSKIMISPEEIDVLNQYRALTVEGKEYIRQTLKMALGQFKQQPAATNDIKDKE